MPKASLTRDSKTSLRKKKKSKSLRKINHSETLEQVVESSPATKFLSSFRSKFVGRTEVKALINNIRRKMATEVTQQARLVKCPECRKILQEPEDVSAYRCGGCDTILQVKNRKADRKAASSSDETEAAHDSHGRIPMAVILSSGESSLDRNNEMGQNEPSDSITEQHGCYALDPSTSRISFESTEFSVPSGPKSKSPVSKIYHGYAPNVSYYDGRSTRAKGAYIHDRSRIPQETPRRDKFPMISDSEMHMQARNSPYGIYGRPISNWIRQKYMSRTPFYPTSPSPYSMYDRASPFHQSYVSTQEEIHHYRNYHRCYGGLGWNHESNFSTIHFSGETSDGRYSKALGQSPLPDHYGHNFYHLYSSYTAAPQKCSYTRHYPNSESYTSRRETYHKVNKYVRENCRVAKRHLCPTKGGAPFVTCYYCLEVLQVPQDSLVLRRKFYQLRCGGCSGVLKFSLQDKTHNVVPYTPCILDSLPSHCSETTLNDQDLALVDKGINGGENGGAISCSGDDCGGSICKGSSSDGELVCLEPSHDLPVDIDAENVCCDIMEVISETPEFHLKQAKYEGEVLREPLGLSERVREMSGVDLEQSHNEYNNQRATTVLDETGGERLGDWLELSHDEKSEAFGPGETTGDGTEVNLEESETKCKNLSENLEAGKTIKENPMFNLEEFQNESENSSGELELDKTVEGKPVFHLEELRNASENSSEELEPVGTIEDKLVFHSEEFGNESEHSSEKLKLGETMGEKLALHLEEFRNEIDSSSEKLEPGENMEEKPALRSEEIRDDTENSSEKVEVDEAMQEKKVFHLGEIRNETENSRDTIESDQTVGDNRPGFHVKKSQNETVNSSKTLESIGRAGERPALHLDEFEDKNENSSEPFKFGETMSKRSTFNLEESEDDTNNSNGSLDAEETRLETLMFQLELSQDKQKSSREMLEPDDDESGETVEETLTFHLETAQDENDSSMKTLEPYSQFYETIDPSEIVGLRQALYPMQGSPLRSPLASPLHTPVGSPLRYPTGSTLRSPIISPLRSPTGSPFSLSSGLFFSK